MNLDLQRAVVELREDVAGLRQVKKDSYEQWLADSAQKFLIELGQKEEDLTKAEEALREAALAQYAVTKDKKPMPGCGIRIQDKLEYDPHEALAWAYEHQCALALVTKEFEGVVSALVALPSFVTRKTVTTATLAQDMAGVVEGVGE
ncbi:hypothetical protein LCGC14_0984930 [marine sediment metagenome]|uniref:Uncharacterized protein n=2 Tax=marine sediment metagenome TaxID=412755 RepID=A0A0F9RE44_9ZZZZ